MTDALNKQLDGAGLKHAFGLVKGIVGELEAPYTEVEWVESNGQQFVYLDWKPPIATWGFEADFVIRNEFTTTSNGWNPTTNAQNGGFLFGTQNSSQNNDIQIGAYGSTGYFRIGGTAGGSASTYDVGWKKDKTRQTLKLHGTTVTKPDGTTMSVTRATEVANKPYANMVVFGYHSGLRKSGTGTFNWPSTARIYSLKFYDGDTLEVDLVGAVRNRDGMTGLYDKVKGHFYPAVNMTYGDPVGTLGEPETVVKALAKKDVKVNVDNRTDTRMWRATVPELDKLEDGQKITLVFSSTVTASYQTTELAGWDDTGNNYYVYLKLTLADGTVTDWIPCFYGPGTRLTTHYGSAVPLILTYRENVCYAATPTSAGTGVARAWYADANYVDGNTLQNSVGYQCLKTGAVGIWATSFFMEDGNGTYQNICTASDGTVTSSNRTTATTKKANPNGFRVGSTVSYTTTTYAANTHISGNNVVYTNCTLIDSRYSLNTTLTAGSLTAQAPVYLVGTIGNDGLYYLDETWWTQAPVDTSKVYVLLGGCYDSTASNCRINLFEHNPWYVYDGTRLVELDHKRILDLQSITENAVGDQIRVSAKQYTGDSTTDYYRKLAVLPIDNSGNGSSIIISGRCGGWVQSNFGYIEVLLTNRTTSYSGDTITAAASSSGASGMYGFCDVVAYSQNDKSAIVYLKLKSYYAYDLVMQTCSGVTKAYSEDYVTPVGTLIWSLSESPQTKLSPTGTLTAPGFTGPLTGNVTGNVLGDVRGGIKPTTVRPASANTTGYDARLNYLLATSSMTTGKPDGDGHVLDMEWDNNGKWHGQFSVPTDGIKQAQWRSENGGTWTSWRKLLDDAHTVTIAQGGTGATTADAAWTALGGGAIGKKASLAASDIPNLSTDKLTSGTLPVARGGTGKTTGADAANYFLNELSTGSSDPVDNDYYISQYVSGGTTTTTYHRRPVSKLWNYIKSKISSWMKNNTSKGALGWSSSTNDTMPVTSNTLAYWNGAYQNTSSNLTYCVKGAFGTAAAADLSDSTTSSSSTAAASSKAVNDALTATKTYADDGGRNYLNNTGNLTLWNKEAGVTVSWNETYNMYEISDSTHTGEKWGIYQDIPVDPSTTYTFSLWTMAGEVTPHVGIGSYEGNPSWPTSRITPTTTKTKHTYTWTTGAAHTKARIYLAQFPVSGGANKTYFYLPKLEKGQHYTDWTPAPEDVDAAIAAVDAKSGVTGVKGNSESTYRTGNVNVTAANVGAVAKSGDTMTGALTLPGGLYTDDNSTAALKLANSNIIGVNSIYTADESDNASEGIHFYRDASHFDSIHAKAGTLYFTPNRPLGSAGTSYPVLTTSNGVTGVKGNSESSYRIGQVNLTAGNVGAIPVGSQMMTTNPFAPSGHGASSLYISKIDNGLYLADKRWTVTSTGATGTSGSLAYLFNGDYESRYRIPENQTAVITIDFTQGSEAQSNGYFPGYPYGYIIVSFYYTALPTSITGRVYCNYSGQGVGWHDLTFTTMENSAASATCYRARQNYYNISQIEITVEGAKHASDYWADITQIELHLDRPYPDRNPFITKYAADKLYFPLTIAGGLKWASGDALPAVTNPQYFLTIDGFASGGTTKYVTAANAWTALGGGSIGKKNSLAASDIPSHAASATTYGAGTSSNYGHVKLSDATNSTSDTTSGTAATPKAVNTAWELANTASTTAGQALSAAQGGIVFDTTYTIASNGTVTFTAHVYSCGSEVTSEYADGDFSWYYRLGTGTSTVSLGTGKTKAVTLSTLGYGGSVGCTFTDNN